MEDVKQAMERALAHRMRSRPFEPPTLNKEKLDKSMSQAQAEHQHRHQNQTQHKKQEPQKKNEQQNKQESQPQEPNEQQDGSQPQAAKPQEMVFEVGSPIDVRQINMPRKRDKIARRKVGGRRMNTLALRNRGRYLRQRMLQEGKDIAIDATIRAAAPYQKVRFGPNAIRVLSEDIREKERVGKTSAVVLFVVDASGSMGAMQRMESAKGAVLSLLMDSYQKRDKIGMVAFKGKDAELIMPPCSSVDLALSRLKELPTCGKTPLSTGLSRGLQILQGEMRKDEETKLMMVLFRWQGQCRNGWKDQRRADADLGEDQGTRCAHHSHRYRGSGELLHGYEARLLSTDSRNNRRKALSYIRLKPRNALPNREWGTEDALGEQYLNSTQSMRMQSMNADVIT